MCPGVAVIIGTIAGVWGHDQDPSRTLRSQALVDHFCRSFGQNVSESHTPVINVTFKSLAAKHNYI